MNYKGMQYRITPSSRGGYTLSVGQRHEGGAPSPFGPGVTMPGFIAYYSAHCDTVREAVRRAERLGAVPA